MGTRGAKRFLVCFVMVGALGFAFAEGTTAQTKVGEPPPPSAGGAFMDRLDRIELFSTVTVIDQEINFVLGGTPLRYDGVSTDALLGLRVFSTLLPVPVLDVRYAWQNIDADWTAWTPLPTKMNADDTGHDFRLGALWPIPKVGLVKTGIYDVEDTSAYGIYLVPEIGTVIAKVGVEWSHNLGMDDDLLGFALVTVPYNDWRFSAGISAREEGYAMGGVQVGKEFGSFFAGLGGYLVEDGREAYAVMLGRYAEKAQGGPTFWFVHLNNPEYRRFNLNVAVGKPGIPKMALCSSYANGIYSAMFTDQMGEVLPVAVRSYEEGRVWVRPDEWAQEGTGTWGGLSLNADYIDMDIGYEVFRGGIFYTRPQCAQLLFPHVGPVVERERLIGIGYQDWRYGLEFGTYLGSRPPSKFYKAGRVYMGIRVLSDFNDFLSAMGELRINL